MHILCTFCKSVQLYLITSHGILINYRIMYSFRDNCIEYFMVSKDTKVKGPTGMVSKGMSIIDLRSKNLLHMIDIESVLTM